MIAASNDELATLHRAVRVCKAMPAELALTALTLYP